MTFETASEADLLKCGAWVYAMDLSTQILCYGFKVVEDRRPEQTIVLRGTDLRNPRTSTNPQVRKLLALVDDPEVVFVAHNNSFEAAIWKYCMEPFGWPPLPTERTHDTMAVSAMKSLPLGLDPLSIVLDLPIKKDMEGHKLMLKMCKPNAKGEWEHSEANMQRLMQYNVGDVDSQYGSHIVLGPLGAERKNWILDQKINQRGILIDRGFVKACQNVLEQVRTPMTERFKELTGGIAPTQREKILNWINDQGVPLGDMKKGTLDAILDPSDNIGIEEFNEPMPSEVYEVIKLRRSLASSSVAKLDRMLQCSAVDGRVRYTMQYHGAGTGRACLTGDHEVLTHKHGWVRLDEWSGDQIAVWNSQQELISFQDAEKLEYDYEGPMIHHEAKRIDQIATPDHKMPTYGAYSGLFEPKQVQELTKKYQIPLYGTRPTAFPYDDWALRVLVMVQADGNYPLESGVRLTFRKLRKVERCKTLLRKAGIPFRLRQQPSPDFGARSEHQNIYTFTISERHMPLYLHMFRNKTFGPWLLDVNPTVFFDEVVNWDGYHSGPNSRCYVSTNKTNIDLVMGLAHISGRVAFCRKHHTNHKVWKDSWVLNIWEDCSNRVEVKPEVKEIDFKGKVYCASTSTGYFLVRRNGRAWITGNSGRLIQIQNYPRGSITDKQGLTPEYLAELIETLDISRIQAVWGDDIFDAVISSLRSCIIPGKGRILVAGDYANVECRIALGFAGQHDKTKMMHSGVDVYSEMASLIYHRPVNKKDTPELRHIGKNAVLGLQFGLGAVGFRAKMAPKETVEFCQHTVTTYRKQFAPLLPRYWYGLFEASADAVWCNQGRTYAYDGIEFVKRNGFLTMKLPSNRLIYYPLPKPEKGYNPVTGQETKTWTYMAYQGKKSRRVDAWYGMLMNNLVQGTARDLMFDAAHKAEAAGLPIVFTVHDELVCEPKREEGLALKLKHIMEDLPAWAIERKFLITAEVDEMERYRKG